MQSLYGKLFESPCGLSRFLPNLASSSEAKEPASYEDISPVKLYNIFLEALNSGDSTTELVPSRFNQHRIFPNTGTAILPDESDERGLADKERMVVVIQNCYFEAGIWSEADEFFEHLRKKSGDIENPLKMLSDIVNHNLSNIHILEGVLHILSNYDYSEIDPYGITISLACAVNHSPIVQDLLISCFEKWGAVESIDILESLELDEYWLIEYRDDVVEQLKQKDKTA